MGIEPTRDRLSPALVLKTRGATRQPLTSDTILWHYTTYHSADDTAPPKPLDPTNV